MTQAIMVDTHTHTVLSGHAWSTLRENAAAAAARGMAALCLTEHGYALPGAGPFFLTVAQNMLPPEIEGVRIYYGVEANIMDFTGKVDIEDRMLFGSAWNIASIHDICMQPGTVAENTAAYLGALRHPAVDMLGHIDDIKAQSDFRVVVSEAGRLGKIIEINNNSLNIRKGSRDRITELAVLCREFGVRVAVSSDAHFDAMIGNVGPALELLESLAFPDELIVNRSHAVFEGYQVERRVRLEAAREAFLGNRRSERRMAQKR